KDLGTSVKTFLDWAEIGRLILNVVAPFPRLECWTESKGESKLRTSIHLYYFLTADAELPPAPVTKPYLQWWMDSSYELK
ncbi:mCG144639, partial [Mus musculus]